MTDHQDSGQGPLPPFHTWRPGAGLARRASKKVWMLIGAGVALVVLATIVLALVLRPRAPREVPSEPAAVPQESESSLAFAVNSGELMPAFLRRAGVPDATARDVIKALGYGGFNFRRMRPGDSLTLFHRSEQLVRMHYRQSYDRVYRLDLDPSGIRVSMLLRRVRAVADTLSGTINSSLYESVLELGEKASLVALYTDIFGWEIDFFTEVQPGDSFAIVFERRVADTTFIGYGPIVAVRYKGQLGDLSGFRYTDPDGRTDYYNREGECLRKTFLKSPLVFSRVSSFFGRRFHPIRRVVAAHHGVDYVAPSGTPVSCIADGRVTSAGWAGGYGRLVTVSHPGGYETRYGHLSGFARGVKAGAQITQGQTIGYVGSTGMSTGPHLHYEVRKNGAAVNPLRLDPPRHEPLRPEFLADFHARADSLLPALAGSPPPLQALSHN